jgi:hypothetical protein
LLPPPLVCCGLRPRPRERFTVISSSSDFCDPALRNPALPIEVAPHGTSVYFPHGSAELVFRLLSWEPAQV